MWGRRLPLLVALATVLVACSGPSSRNTLQGAQIEVVAVWSGAEQQQFQRVLEGFERRTGVRITYTSAGHDVSGLLATRVSEGRPPDVAFLPQPGLLDRYADDGVLVPLDRATARAVADNYSPAWRALGSAEGRLFGIPFKAANKSLVWYSVGAFEDAGLVPPDDLSGLEAVERTLIARGVPPFAVGALDGWTVTDWFENLYLGVAGPQWYDLLAAHAISWTDESVRHTLELFVKLLQPDAIAGGVNGALTTGFEASVARAFGASQSQPASDRASPAMVFEGDFVASVIRAGTPAELGVDVDVFPFPSVGTSGPAVVGGGDLAVLMRRSEAATAFMRYLATPEAAARWAAQGGFISPNINVDLSAYPTGISRDIARALLDAGDRFRFDLSDLAPAPFGGVEGQGMRKRLQDLLVSHDVEGTAALLEADAAAAYGR